MPNNDCFYTIKSECKNANIDSIYRCGTCEKTFKKFIIFEGHFAFNAKCRLKSGCFMQCYVCGKKFRHLAVLKYHLRRHVKSKNGLKLKTTAVVDVERESPIGLNCNVYKKSRASSEQMVTHSTVENQSSRNEELVVEIGDSEKPRFFECKICKTDFSEKTALEKHMATHTQPDGLTCGMCGLEFTTDVSLKFHQKVFHRAVIAQKEDKQHKCEICQAKFYFSSNLTRHINDHRLGDVECKICSIRFTKKSLTIHVREAHPKLTMNAVCREIITPITSSASSQHEIRNGQRTPSEENEKECKLCKEKFSTEYQRIQHETVHSGDFECKICRVNFTEMSLALHRSRFHSNEQVEQLCKTTAGKQPRGTGTDKKLRVDTTLRKFNGDTILRTKNFTGIGLCETVTEKQLRESEIDKLSHELKTEKQVRKIVTADQLRANASDKQRQSKRRDQSTTEKQLCEWRTNKQLPDTTTDKQHRKSITEKQLLESNSDKVLRETKMEPRLSEMAANKQLSDSTTDRPGSSIKSMQDRPHHCEFCSAKFTIIQNLKRHKKKHYFGNVECKICSIRFSKGTLQIHIKKVHPELTLNDVCQYAPKEKKQEIRQLASPVTSYSSSERDISQNEKEIPSGEKSKVCKICKETFWSNPRRIRHQKVHKGTFECTTCQIKFTKGALALHKSRLHLNEDIKQLVEGTAVEELSENELEKLRNDVKAEEKLGERKTDKQHDEAKRNGELSETKADAQLGEVEPHIQDERQLGETTTDETVKYKCKFCKHRCRSQAELARHEAVHNGNFECKICRIPFTKISLIRHELRYHTNQRSTIIQKKQYRHKCLICKEGFQYPRDLANHKMLHRGKFRCEICRIPFTKNALKLHNSRFHMLRRNSINNEIRVRNEKSDDSPKDGGESAKQSREIRSLLQNTTSRLKCDKCEKSFRNAFNLEEHQKVHISGELKCKKCRNKFTPFSFQLHPPLCQRCETQPTVSMESTPKEENKIMQECGKENGLSKDNHEIQRNEGRKSSTSAQYLEQHKKEHMSGEFECEVCFTKLSKFTRKSHQRLCRVRNSQPKISEKSTETPKAGELEQPLPESNHLLEGSQLMEESQLEEKELLQQSESLKEDELLEAWQVVEERELLEGNRSTTLLQNKHLLLQCDVCGKSCNTAHNLAQHKKVHITGEFECENCFVKITKNALKSHRALCRRTKKNINEILMKHEPKTNEDDEEMTTEPTYNCDRCDESFTQLSSFEVHMKCHRLYSCNFCGKKFMEKTNLHRHEMLHIYECYVCKNVFPSTKELQCHLTKHIVYQQWVDPINVYLSNWIPELSREILLNQPLVLVENLNIKTIDLNFQSKNVDLIKSEPPEIIGNENSECEENGTDLSLVNGDAPTDVCDELQSIDGEMQFTEEYSAQKPIEVEQKSLDLSLLSDDEEIPIVLVQLPDTTTIFVDDNYELERDVVDVSSESEVSDILELFHCYFCDETFRSLGSLGVHVKTCPFCP